jgi:hypothetical protein
MFAKDAIQHQPILMDKGTEGVVLMPISAKRKEFANGLGKTIEIAMILRELTSRRLDRLARAGPR